MSAAFSAITKVVEYVFWIIFQVNMLKNRNGWRPTAPTLPGATDKSLWYFSMLIFSRESYWNDCVDPTCDFKALHTINVELLVNYAELVPWLHCTSSQL
jgi:hypothetical protein